METCKSRKKSAMFTLKNGDFITNKYVGVGGLNGLSSGEVSSPVAGSKVINWGLIYLQAISRIDPIKLS